MGAAFLILPIFLVSLPVIRKIGGYLIITFINNDDKLIIKHHHLNDYIEIMRNV
jgi:hypothetical protein